VRELDDVASAVALALLAPLMAAVALAIKIDSRGPAILRQQRIGRDGRPFEMLKFRTTVDGTNSQETELLHRNECEGLFKIPDDPRFTRVGRVLRHAYLGICPGL
jgi:lipopolysaccharide/colanic/teichoic acid biosynthesis glycosyltransferase